MQLREAESTRGRLAMLASLGFLVQENFHPLFLADGGPGHRANPEAPASALVSHDLGHRNRGIRADSKRLRESL